MAHLRLISLCNVLMRLISKVLANRLKVLLPRIISPNHTAFVRSKLISDNLITASEFVNPLSRWRTAKKGFLSLKLDMSKAYDRIEWSYLWRVLQKLGFPPPWSNLIMAAVSTVDYSVIVNRIPKGFIHPSQGFRQGNPFSQYLFLLCAEGLAALLDVRE